MKVDSFSEIEEEFRRRVEKIVWCTVATVDPKGRPRSRILHPIWNGSRGWIATGRTSPKAAHLAAYDHVSLSYWTPDQEQVYAECRTEWRDDLAEKKRLWKLFKETPDPMGYDPGLFWKSPEDPDCGFLELFPWRIEIWSLGSMMQGQAPQVWEPGSK